MRRHPFASAGIAAALAALALGCRATPPPERGAREASPEPRGQAIEKKVRPPAAAGAFYPADPTVLSSTVKALLAAAPRVAVGPVRIVLAPHAGLEFSGRVAAAAFRQLDPGFRRAVILAANHDGSSWFEGYSVDRATHYAVPGLEVPVAGTARALAARPGATDAPPGAHRMHMIEIELPFLAKANGGRPFEIVPVIVGELTLESAGALAGELAALAEPETVFVFSIDLSHYHTYDVAVARDRACLDALVKMDPPAVARCDTDGTQALVTLSDLAGLLRVRPRLVAYQNSGDVNGDLGRVVGYGAIVWERPKSADAPGTAAPPAPRPTGLTRGEKAALLDLARRSLVRAVKEGRPADVPPDLAARFPRLGAPGAAFVTLREAGALRGCIGSLEAQVPLAQDVAGHALDAALRDLRFAPVQPEELSRIRLSISVLEPPRPEAGAGPDLLRRLGADKPGVILEYEGRSSTFLPMVWEELPDPARFLAALCQKQGFAPNCWATSPARFRTYGAEEFAEAER